MALDLDYETELSTQLFVEVTRLAHAEPYASMHPNAAALALAKAFALKLGAGREADAHTMLGEMYVEVTAQMKAVAAEKKAFDDAR